MKRIVLNKNIVRSLFEKYSDQIELLAAIYQLLYPEWEQIIKLDGWPVISHEANLWITEQFIQFDKKHHPKLMPGGLWMNVGFSSSGGNATGWEVDISRVRVIYKKEKECQRLKS
ncbi:MAG: hypothetical protein HQK83_04585 [Fibrobacteria bacterium]|nr:hypothetical protein [Fibrobacteria bacterium]